MPKVALIAYHKNLSIYPKEWIEQYKKSVMSQTYKDFDIFEMDYGGEDNRIFENSHWQSMELPTFVHAMNSLLDFCFKTNDYQYIANSNIDDYYTHDRLEKQIKYCRHGYGIISCNFALIENDNITLVHRFHRLHILEELSKNHNIICHPAILMSREFWNLNKYNPSEIPLEDLKLWKRGINNSKFIILEDVLCFHRVHSQSVCQSTNR